MKLFITLAAMLLLTTQSGAETYSWIDDNGTHNFTEDLSSVPKKYLKKVNRLGDMGNSSASQESASPEKKTVPAETSAAKPVATVPEKGLYGGKSRDAWRQEFDVQEAELTKLEQHLNLLYKQSVKSPILPRDQYVTMKKEYDDTKAAYDQKYKVYKELLDSARKAGLTVEMKK